MAEHGMCILPKGSSTSAPPLFDGENFINWQRRMKIFIKASEYGLWDVFQIGNYIPTEVIDGQNIPKCRSQYNEDDKKQIVLNDKAVNTLLCALTEKEFLQISNLETAKEMWEALEISYGESIEEASSTGECSYDEEKAKICLVAEGEEADSDSDNEVTDSEPTYDELLSEYNDMHSEFIKMAKELICAKKKIKSLEEKLKETPEAAHECTKCIESEEKIKVLKGDQRYISDKSGMNKDPIFKRKERKRNEKLFCDNSFLSAHCFHCNRKGHSITSCHYKKNESCGKFKWVPKGTYVPKAKANRSGPKRKWVPRYPPTFISLQDITMNGQANRKVSKQEIQRMNQQTLRQPIARVTKFNYQKKQWRRSKPIPHISKTIHKRNRWKQGKARASMINYHRVPFCYEKRRRKYWVW